MSKKAKRKAGSKPAWPAAAAPRVKCGIGKAKGKQKLPKAVAAAAQGKAKQASTAAAKRKPWFKKAQAKKKKRQQGTSQSEQAAAGRAAGGSPPGTAVQAVTAPVGAKRRNKKQAAAAATAAAEADIVDESFLRQPTSKTIETPQLELAWLRVNRAALAAKMTDDKSKVQNKLQGIAVEAAKQEALAAAAAAMAAVAAFKKKQKAAAAAQHQQAAVSAAEASEAAAAAPQTSSAVHLCQRATLMVRMGQRKVFQVRAPAQPKQNKQQLQQQQNVKKQKGKKNCLQSPGARKGQKAAAKQLASAEPLPSTGQANSKKRKLQPAVADVAPGSAAAAAPPVQQGKASRPKKVVLVGKRAAAAKRQVQQPAEAEDAAPVASEDCAAREAVADEVPAPKKRKLAAGTSPGKPKERKLEQLEAGRVLYCFDSNVLYKTKESGVAEAWDAIERAGGDVVQALVPLKVLMEVRYAAKRLRPGGMGGYKLLQTMMACHKCCRVQREDEQYRSHPLKPDSQRGDDSILDCLLYFTALGAQVVLVTQDKYFTQRALEQSIPSMHPQELSQVLQASLSGNEDGSDEGCEDGSSGGGDPCTVATCDAAAAGPGSAGAAAPAVAAPEPAPWTELHDRELAALLLTPGYQRAVLGTAFPTHSKEAFAAFAERLKQPVEQVMLAAAEVLASATVLAPAAAARAAASCPGSMGGFSGMGGMFAPAPAMQWPASTCAAAMHPTPAVFAPPGPIGGGGMSTEISSLHHFHHFQQQQQFMQQQQLLQQHLARQQQQLLQQHLARQQQQMQQSIAVGQPSWAVPHAGISYPPNSPPLPQIHAQEASYHPGAFQPPLVACYQQRGQAAHVQPVVCATAVAPESPHAAAMDRLPGATQADPPASDCAGFFWEHQQRREKQQQQHGESSHSSAAAVETAAMLATSALVQQDAGRGKEADPPPPLPPSPPPPPPFQHPSAPAQLQQQKHEQQEEQVMGVNYECHDEEKKQKEEEDERDEQLLSLVQSLVLSALCTLPRRQGTLQQVQHAIKSSPGLSCWLGGKLARKQRGVSRWRVAAKKLLHRTWVARPVKAASQHGETIYQLAPFALHLDW